MFLPYFPLFLQMKEQYNGDLNSGHLNTGNIWIPDKYWSGFSNVNYDIIMCQFLVRRKKESDPKSPTFLHLFELDTKVMKKELTFLHRSVDCGAHFSRQNLTIGHDKMAVFKRFTPGLL
jgi:hypothetical protein